MSYERKFDSLSKTHKPAIAKFENGEVVAKVGDKVYIRDVGEDEFVCTIVHATTKRVFAQIDGEQEGWYFPKKWNWFGHHPYAFADASLWVAK